MPSSSVDLLIFILKTEWSSSAFGAFDPIVWVIFIDSICGGNGNWAISFINSFQAKTETGSAIFHMMNFAHFADFKHNQDTFQSNAERLKLPFISSNKISHHELATLHSFTV